MCSSAIFIAEIVLTCFLAVVFLLGIRTQFWLGGFRSHYVSVAVEQSASLILLTVFALLFLVYFIMWHVILNKIKVKHLIFLDMMLDDAGEFDRVKSTNRLCALRIDGFSVVHQICVSWTLLEMATQVWPESAMAWARKPSPFRH